MSDRLPVSTLGGVSGYYNGKIYLTNGITTSGLHFSTVGHNGVVSGDSLKTLATRYPKCIIGGESGYWNAKLYMTDGYSPDSSDHQAGFEGPLRFG